MSREKIKRILVIRIDFLGDMVCTTPLLHSLRQRWPESEIHVLANKYNAAVLIDNPDINKVHYYVYSRAFHKNIRPGLLNALIDRLRLIFRLRREKFNLLIIPNGGMNKNSIKFAKQLNVSDCRWHNSDTEFDDRKQSHIATRPMMHKAFSGYRLVPELAVPALDKLRLWIYPQQGAVLQPLPVLQEGPRARIGFFVSNNSEARRWGWKKWKHLSEKVALLNDVIIFHAPEEIFPGDWQDGEGVYRISTHSVADLIAEMSQLTIAVSADSAPVHIAAAMNIPVVALFESRPEKVLRWYPVGVRNIVIHQGRNVGCISVSSVYLAIEKLLIEIKG